MGYAGGVLVAGIPRTTIFWRGVVSLYLCMNATISSAACSACSLQSQEDARKYITPLAADSCSAISMSFLSLSSRTLCEEGLTSQHICVGVDRFCFICFPFSSPSRYLSV